MVFSVKKSTFFCVSWFSVGISANKSSCCEGIFGWLSRLLRILSASDLNSNSTKSFLNSSLSGSLSFNSSRLSCMGTSVRIVARNFDILMSSTAFSTFSRNFPLISSVCCKRWSIVPNSLMSFTAVFSPTPGQPGKLSAESPISAKRSITCEVDWMPYF